MKAMKDVALMMIGAGAVLAYQKYSEPMKNMIEEKVQSVKKSLEDMM